MRLPWEKHQPRNEEDYLRLLLGLILTDTMWKTVSKYGFSDTNLDALTKKIYKIRNEIAHGKASSKLEIMVPSMLSKAELIIKRAVFKVVAKEALIKLGGVGPL